MKRSRQLRLLEGRANDVVAAAVTWRNRLAAGAETEPKALAELVEAFGRVVRLRRALQAARPK